MESMFKGDAIHTMTLEEVRQHAIGTELRLRMALADKKQAAGTERHRIMKGVRHFFYGIPNAPAVSTLVEGQFLLDQMKKMHQALLDLGVEVDSRY